MRHRKGGKGAHKISCFSNPKNASNNTILVYTYNPVGTNHNNKMIFHIVKSLALTAVLAISADAQHPWDADDCWPDDPPFNPPTDPPTDPPTQPPTESSCVGKVVMDTNLDFFEAEVTDNDLQYGGTIKYENVGVIRDKPVDMVVSVVPGTTYWSPKADLRNGMVGEFGQINLFAELHDLEAGEGNFRFCFHDHETGEITTADSFAWSVYDVDERNAAEDGIKEVLLMDMSQAEEYTLYPNVEDSEIVVSCEDSDSPPPCPPGVRTSFHSSTRGGLLDNPSNPDEMTELQKKRSIVYVFKDTDCWDFTYKHYCRYEEETGEACMWYGGGNFLFAGAASEVIEEGECYTTPHTDAPSTEPSASPTGEPTEAPTGSPTASPTGEPSEVPTGSPTASPSDSPMVGPTDVPTASPSDSPTVGPTGAPTTSPSDPPTGAPTNAPTASPSDSPTNAPSHKPSLHASLDLETRAEDDTVGDDFFFPPPPDCPSDVQVLRTVGVTEFPPVETTSTVSVLSKNVEDNTVTVALNQAWPDSSIDSIYYQWFPDYLNEKCVQETDVASGDTYAEITLQCNFLKPFAKMTICLEESVDDGFLQPGDDATIPQCCHSGESEEDTASVCYTLEISCAPGCPEGDAQQAVRRKRKLRGANHRN